MLTDDIISVIYSHEIHPKHSRIAKFILYIIAAFMINLAIFMIIKSENISYAAVQALIAIAIIIEANSKIGFSQAYIEDVVNKLTEINLNIVSIKDIKFRVETVKEFNYYIDLILDRPNSVSINTLNKFLKAIQEEIIQENEAERQGYHFTTEEEFEEKRRQEEEAFQKRKAEYKRKEREEREKDRKQQNTNKENKKIDFFKDCFTMEDLNKRKRELLKQYHPDNHSNGLEKEQCEQIAKEINEAFVVAKNNLINDFNF